MMDPLQEAEHDCWLQVVKELKKLGIIIDNADALNDAMIDWGERLAQLRELTGQVYTNARPQLG